MVVNIKSKKHASSGVSGHAGSRGSLLAKLFLSTLYLSAFTFGGGYVIVTLMKKKFVDEYHWIDEQEMLDLVAIAQSSPGAIAVNGAIVVGYKLAGIAGVLTTVIATVHHPDSDFLLLRRLPLQPFCGMDVKRNAGRRGSCYCPGGLGDGQRHRKRQAVDIRPDHGRCLYRQLCIQCQRSPDHSFVRRHRCGADPLCRA